MRFTNGILALAVALLLVSVCQADFNVKKAKQLAKITKTSALLGGNKRKIRRFKKAVRKIRKKFSTCSPNVCFALDGSGSINDDEWELQKSFVELSIGALGGLEGSRFAAVEYADIANAIVPDLAPATPQMLFTVRDADRDGGFTFLGPAIQWCSSKIALHPAAVNKIILLGDGDSTFGDPYGPFGAVKLAKDFRNRGVGYATCAGLVDPRFGPPLKQIFEDIVGNPDLVFKEDKWADMITVVFALVELICKV